MSNVEDEIVSLQFDNRQFESGVAQSISTTEKLKTSLQFTGAASGLGEVDRAVKGFSLNPIAAGIQGINKAWLGMTTIAVTAIGNITNRAVNAGIEMGKALTLDPIKAGFSNYETKINAVQTILANTADQGTNLKQVTGQLNILNDYANQTVYNFSEMAKNIGTFTAAGVDLKTSTASIKGIANLAALSGSTADQASGAMYQLSQAIAAGQVHLQDWNSVVNAGIGGAVFQKNLIESALATGTLDASQVHLGKTMADTTVNGVAFRQSLTPPPGGTSWLTSGVLTKSLGTFTGDLSKAQLVAQGFTKDQAAAIVKQGQVAVDAATKIKTFTQLFQALKEEVASAWSSVFEALFGNINQAKAFLTPLHNFLQNALTAPIYEIADALKSWRTAGGFEDLLAIFKNIGTIIGNLLYPFKELFGKLLPSAGHAGKGLEGFTKTLAEITGWIAKATSVTHKFGSVLKPVQTVFGYLADAAVAFFKALSPLLPIFKEFGTYVSSLFDQGASIASSLIDGWVQGLDPKALQQAAVDLANSWIQWIKDALGIHSPADTMIPIGLNIVQGIVEGLQKGASALISGLQKLVSGIGQTLKAVLENIDYGQVLDTVNTGLFFGFYLLFKKFVGVFDQTVGSFKELTEKAGGVLDQFTSNLKTMQNKVRSEIIRNIAISVLMLAGAALLLSTLDTKKLTQALAAIGGLMIGLIGSMKVLTAGGGGKHNAALDPKVIAKQTAQLLAISAAMVSFATAILIMSAAVAVMGQLKPKTMERGLAGVAAVIALVVAATAILGKTGGGATILAASTALLILSAALTVFVGVMELYSKIDFGTIASGGGKAALVIAAVGLAMRSFGKGAIGGATGMVIASAALFVIAKALQQLANIGLGDMIKAVLALDFVLAGLAAATADMTPASASSLLIMSAAIVVLAHALQILGKMSLWSLIKAILAITAAIVVLAVTSAALAELSPLVLALGTALLVLGGAIFLAGAGVFLFASAMGILAIVGPAAFQALADGIDTLLAVLPKIGEALGEAMVSFLTGIVNAGGPLVKALGKLLGLLLDALSNLIPKAQRLVTRLINALFSVIVHEYGHAAKVMLGFVLNLIQTLEDNVPKLIKEGTNLIIAIIQGLAANGVRIANATGRAILQFLNGLDKAINKYEPQIIRVGINIGSDLVSGLVKGLTSSDVVQRVVSAAENLAGHIPGPIRKVLGIGSPSKVTAEIGRWTVLGLAKGIDDNTHHAEKSSENMGNKAMDALRMTFRNSREAANSLMDLQPKVTPVLDLTQLQKDATKIGSALGDHKISTEMTRRQARNVASSEASRHAHTGDGNNGGDTYYEQNIYSPKNVKPITVYRGTKSLLALNKN